MRNGRDKVEKLAQRLDRVRAKVEASDERDGEGTRRAGKRLRMLWGMIACWGLIAVVLWVTRQWGHAGAHVRKERAMLLDDRLRSLDRDNVGRSTNKMAAETTSGEVTKNQEERVKQGSEMPRGDASRVPRSAVNEDSVFRLFDEL